MTTHAQFDQYASDGYTLIPVVREVLSDLDTPLSVYLKLADGPHTYLFESVEGGERFGRYSIIGLPARRVYAFARPHAGRARARRSWSRPATVADPLAEVERLRASTRCRRSPACRVSPAGWSAGSASSASNTSSRGWRPTADKPRRTGHARHPADAQRRAGGVRQPQGPAVPDRARRPARAAGVGARQPPAGRAGAPAAPRRRAVSGNPAAGSAGREPTSSPASPAKASSTRSRRSQGLHPRRRHLPGGAEPAHERAVPGAPGGRLSRAACAESVAVHVLPRRRRHPGGGLVAGDPGAPAGRQGHGAPDRRHPPARRRRRSRTWRWKPNCWPIRRSAPST